MSNPKRRLGLVSLLLLAFGVSSCVFEGGFGHHHRSSRHGGHCR